MAEKDSKARATTGTPEKSKPRKKAAGRARKVATGSAESGTKNRNKAPKTTGKKVHQQSPRTPGKVPARAEYFAQTARKVTGKAKKPVARRDAAKKTRAQHTASGEVQKTAGSTSKTAREETDKGALATVGTSRARANTSTREGTGAGSSVTKNTEATARVYYDDQLRSAVRLLLRCGADSEASATALLYDRWYAPSAGTQAISVKPAELVAHLRASDRLGSRYETGWHVVDPREAVLRIGPSSSPWQVAAIRDTELRWVDPVDFVNPGSVGLRPPSGKLIYVSLRRDSAHALPGWWTTVSPAWQQASEDLLLRVYWSIEPAGVCALVRALTDSLDPAIRYALKCPLELGRFSRPDGVTLYLAASAWDTAVPAVRAAHACVIDHMRQQVPAFTLRLSKGLALAEDPPDGSFGMSRCAVLSKGIWNALASSDELKITRAAELALQDRGLRLHAPYLNPGSTRKYP